MKHIYLLSAALLLTQLTSAQQQSRTANGGGGYEPPSSQCISPAQRDAIQAMLAENKKMLTEKGVLSDAPNKTTAATFDWPLQQASGFNYFSIYGISNYVDHAPAQNVLQDWNCGTRSYDLAGYNHSGMDIFLWPFDQNMQQAQQARIVAAAPGIITGKSDGNFDQNCAMGNAQWNAIYVQHSDGTTAWYGHMKAGSLTTKIVGDAVSTGEYLGSVGSSGSSTGPHLHFELLAANNTTLDPYHGNCNAPASLWNTQKPYYEPAVNALMTHHAAPVFKTCPQQHVMNARDTFKPGDQLYFAAYYHDQRQGEQTAYKIYRPDNTAYDAWQHASTTPHFSASYWFWSNTLPTNAPTGKWRFEAVYQGQTRTHDFWVQYPTSIAAASLAALSIYPNPAQDLLTIKYPGRINQLELHDVSGRKMNADTDPAAGSVKLSNVADGIYFLMIATDDGNVTRKVQVQR